MVSTWDQVRETHGAAICSKALHCSQAVQPAGELLLTERTVLLLMCAPLSNSFLLLASDFDSMGKFSFYCCGSKFFLQMEKLAKELLDDVCLNGWSSETITAGPNLTGITS